MQLQDASGNTVEEISEDERGYFAVNPETREKDETLDLEVVVETVQLADPQRMWTFRSGNQKFNAKVQDEEFLNQVKQDGIYVTGNTKLVVSRREVGRVQPSGEAKSSYYITKVHNVSNQEQDQLFD